MTDQEYKDQIKPLRDKIAEIQRQYKAENARFKAGDYVRNIDNPEKVGKVLRVNFDESYNDPTIYIKVAKLKKNGEPHKSATYGLMMIGHPQKFWEKCKKPLQV